MTVLVRLRSTAPSLAHANNAMEQLHYTKESIFPLTRFPIFGHLEIDETAVHRPRIPYMDKMENQEKHE